MKKVLFLIIALMFFEGCKTTDPGSIPVSGPVYKKPGDFNFIVNVQDINISNPANDKRSYYKIYIDKIESGRTAIGLESQNKSFSAALSVNKHLLEVEKYVLDETQGKYVKVNNIYQPKPAFTYFDIPADRIVKITIIQDTSNNKAEIVFEYDKD